VGCSGAGGARDCGCGAAEVADGGEQRLRRRSGGCAERRRSRGAKMRACERVKEVEEGSWTCCGTKKRHGRAGVAAGDGGATRRGGEKPARVRQAAGGRAGGPGGAGRAARGSWQPERSPARGRRAAQQ
jgi:hypothetical protein